MLGLLKRGDQTMARWTRLTEETAAAEPTGHPARAENFVDCVLSCLG